MVRKFYSYNIIIIIPNNCPFRGVMQIQLLFNEIVLVINEGNVILAILKVKI